MSAADAAPAEGADEGVTLESILRCADAPPAPPTAHELAVQSFIGSVPPVSSSGRVHLEVGDPFARVVDWARQLAGREIGSCATWIRLRRSDLARGAVFVVSGLGPTGDADLIVVADRGVLTRSVLVDVSKWLFFALGLSRATVRIPVARTDLQDLCRRSGFVFEGTARGYFHGEGDASVWSMTARSCRWLAPRSPAPPLPVADTPFLSLKVH